MEREAQSSQSSEAAAKAVLLEECEEQFGLLQKLQNEIILADTEANDDQSNEAVNRLIAITSELEQWQEMEPKLLTTSPEVLLAVGKEELQRLNNQLKMVLSCSQAKLDAQKKILKRCRAFKSTKEREREISGQETDSAFAVAQYRAPGSVKGEITDLLANAGVPLFASSPGVEMMGFP
ncbi:centromere protein K-like [Sinocyclocheilus rhinocerous]|uniref:centromere protein K-like n=1 Tax=Sinocyclocheilus rhinocerous TaxID=307959 RepID=UPI0007B8DD2E|nr:PREDICTED: centromere protein K-like [Sinocyclocheilus rhinocerous]